MCINIPVAVNIKIVMTEHSFKPYDIRIFINFKQPTKRDQCQKITIVLNTGLFPVVSTKLFFHRQREAGEKPPVKGSALHIHEHCGRRVGGKE